jgi:NDP-sugar pyrophosphorylase family protein
MIPLRHALVLTAGLGTRLRPLTDVRAKPAIPVAGEPLIRRIAAWLVSRGVDELVLNLHHRPETLTAILGDGCDLGARVRYSWEVPRILGSAGGPRLARAIVGADPFLIVNGDTLTDVNIGALQRQHADTDALVTLALMPHPRPGRYRGVVADADGRVTGFAPAESPVESWHFVGVQAVNAEVFAPLAPGQAAESVAGLYQELVARHPGRVRAFRAGGEFRDVGTADDYLRTCLDMASRLGLGEPPAGVGTVVGASAKLVHSVLWDRVRVGARATLDRCVVADDVVIPPGARFARSAIVRAGSGPAGPHDMIVGDLLVSPLGAEAGVRHDPRGMAPAMGTAARKDVEP